MMMAPIGRFECAARHPYDAPRQAVLARGSRGTVVLEPGFDFEQALRDLAGFERIWLIFEFHGNGAWKPMVRPPRAPRKVGVFATRAPYRPNAIGLSCVELLAVEGLRVEVGAHDLLDGTPILDIKPYLPYADSFPNARCGWLDAVEAKAWRVSFSEHALRDLAWIEERTGHQLRAFLVQQLSENPLDGSRKRVRRVSEGIWEMAYRTWRANFRTEDISQEILVTGIRSAYSPDELESPEDRYGDKPLHRLFIDRTAEPGETPEKQKE